ncbi:GNAT family N-acetyltransferase [Sphingomonas sp. DG1-23]|uniref:GNAT family N-acetyltransferase n=1 Tax=Sphingomonas sp. DG1-23 TaxID=3068316 RepID=UPI00273D7C2E|nr:GNAT family N-acetyltransferase [Sphingomonas sp. DG1-23]MDP5277476.1 GNAT family N-acetyltransferase [Sphingomonas sp. DG1-23]
MDERADLEALQRRASLAWETYREALLQHPEAIDLPVGQIIKGDVFVCEREDGVKGFMVVLSRPDGQAELDGLFVDPAVWRTGLGRDLVRAARAVASRRGANSLQVVAAPEARGFYEACGFVASGTAQTRFGPAINMTLALERPADRS